VAGLVAIMTRPRPARLLAGFLLGGMLISIGLGIAIVGSLEDSGAVSGHKPATSPVVDITVGVISLCLAWTVAHGHSARFSAWRARRQAAGEPRPSWSTRALQRGSVALSFVAGILLNLPSLWYLVALSDIAEADLSFPHEVLLIVVFNLVMFLLVEITLLLCVLAPTRAERMNHELMQWLRAHAREIVVGLAAVVGAALVVRGVVAAV
jgi:Sap-like sulfolipid-1-addressing protein